MSLPIDAASRKHIPIGTGVLDYFPNALAEIAKVSLEGQRQHNITGPLKWDRSKSTDEADALIRHFLQRGTIDTDGMRHSAKCAWRALALLEKELEKKGTETDEPTPIPQLEFTPGATLTCRGDEFYTDIVMDNEQSLRDANRALQDFDWNSTGTVSVLQHGNKTHINIFSADGRSGQGFVVRGALRWKENGQRPAIQPTQYDPRVPKIQARNPVGIIQPHEPFNGDGDRNG